MTDTTVLQPETNPSNSAHSSGMTYYEYICTWVDDFLTVSQEAKVLLRDIGSVYKLKESDGSKEPWETPKRYLGSDCGDYEMFNRTKA